MPQAANVIHEVNLEVDGAHGGYNRFVILISLDEVIDLIQIRSKQLS